MSDIEKNSELLPAATDGDIVEKGSKVKLLDLILRKQ